MAKKEPFFGSPFIMGGSGTSVLFGHLQGVLNARDCHEYEQMLQNLPEKCRDNYHDLLQKAVMYIVIMFDCRRGLEGLAAMERNFFCKKCRYLSQDSGIWKPIILTISAS